MIRGEKTKRGFVPLMLIACILALIPNSKSLRAQLVAFSATGVVTGFTTHSGLSFDDSVAVGSLMTGTCIYDTDAIPTIPEGSTYPLSSISVSIGNYTFTHNPISPKPARFKIWQGGNYFYTVYSYSPRFEGSVYLDQVPKTYDDLDWAGFGLSLMYLTGQGQRPDSNDTPDSGHTSGPLGFQFS